jgi:sigma-E factor negative regulatory protein RseC
MEEFGVVIETRDSEAKVLVPRSDFCEKCPSCCEFMSREEVIATVLNPINAKVGETVKLSLERRFAYIAAFWVYIVPILSFIIGTLLGFYISPVIGLARQAEVIAILTGFISLVAAFIFIYLRYGQGKERVKQYRPVITEVIKKKSCA